MGSPFITVFHRQKMNKQHLLFSIVLLYNSNILAGVAAAAAVVIVVDLQSRMGCLIQNENLKINI